MDLITVEAKTINEVWQRTIYELVNRAGEKNMIHTIDQGSYAGQKRLEVDFITLRVEYPEVRPFVIMPDGLNIPPPFDDKYLDEYALYIMTEHKPKNTEYTYGSRLFGSISDGIIVSNQVEEIIKKYRKYKRTNQCCMEIGQPSDILLNDSCCARVLDTRIQDNKLHFYLYFRSWDLFNGTPVNLAGFQLLKELMADEIGVKAGETIACSKGLHLYEHIWDIAKLLSRKDKDYRFIGE